MKRILKYERKLQRKKASYEGIQEDIQIENCNKRYKKFTVNIDMKSCGMEEIYI